jgi:hypothetical protein
MVTGNEEITVRGRCKGDVPARPRRALLKALVLLAIVLAVWASYDRLRKPASHIRQFDPAEVGRLETEMWRSYYERRRVSLFSQLTETLRTQYGLSFLRSNLVGYRAAKAALVFKDGNSRADYEKALPDLVSFYRSIRETSDVPFDPDRAARLELEWWIIHRQRADHPPQDLVNALADLQAEIYRVPAPSLLEHARLRAEAMTIRDNRAEQGGVTQADWDRIGELLNQSWQSLHTAVNHPSPDA